MALVCRQQAKNPFVEEKGGMAGETIDSCASVLCLSVKTGGDIGGAHSLDQSKCRHLLGTLTFFFFISMKSKAKGVTKKKYSKRNLIFSFVIKDGI